MDALLIVIFGVLGICVWFIFQIREGIAEQLKDESKAPIDEFEISESLQKKIEEYKKQKKNS